MWRWDLSRELIAALALSASGYALLLLGHGIGL